MKAAQPIQVFFLSLMMSIAVGCGSDDSPSDPQTDAPPAPERIAAENNPDLAAQAAQASVVQMLVLEKRRRVGGLHPGVLRRTEQNRKRRPTPTASGSIRGKLGREADPCARTGIRNHPDH